MIKGLLQLKPSTKNSFSLGKVHEGFRIPMISDVMFDTMFHHPERKQYVCFLLSKVLGEDQKEIEETIRFEKEALEKENYHDSKKILDLLCSVGDRYYNIEINNNPLISSLERNIAYLGDIYKRKMKRGKKDEYQNVVQININNFSFEGHEEVMEVYQYRDEKGRLLTDKITIIYIYLPNIKKKYYNKEKLTELEEFLFICNETNEEEIKEICERNAIMKEYVEEAKKASKKTTIVKLYDKERQKAYDYKQEIYRQSEEAEERGERIGLDKGEKIGLDKGIHQVALTMLKKNLDINLIAECTGLTSNQLQSLMQK